MYRTKMSNFKEFFDKKGISFEPTFHENSLLLQGIVLFTIYKLPIDRQLITRFITLGFQFHNLETGELQEFSSTLLAKMYSEQVLSHKTQKQCVII